ncbi:hypothetical protein [Rhizorhabdus sp.]|uniref:hypothetical protein n=1 Tax=Rhizorhabdus sp. TaxID=1968843 RepID=UPI001984FBA6|nr:hypothetical protein [Rhizorhabdus sp.]MBD3760209.1 hypothetical protein [Rhizorhabdus sp.]
MIAANPLHLPAGSKEWASSGAMATSMRRVRMSRSAYTRVNQLPEMIADMQMRVG